jgi:hypothetical protein
MILQFKRSKENAPSENDPEIYSADAVLGSINGATGLEDRVEVDLYVQMSEIGDTDILIICDTGAAATVTLTPEQSRAFGRALLGKYD